MDRALNSRNFRRPVSAGNCTISELEQLRRNAAQKNAPRENAPRENAPRENAPRENAPRENAAIQNASETSALPAAWDWSILPEWYTSPNSGRILPEKVRLPLPAGTPKVLAKWREYVSERRIRTGYVQILEEQMTDALLILQKAFRSHGEEGLLAVLELGIRGGKDGKNWLRLEYPELKKTVRDAVEANRAVWRKLGYFGNLWDSRDPGLPSQYEYDFWDKYHSSPDPYGRYLAALNGAAKAIDAELFPAPSGRVATRVEILQALISVFDMMGKNSHPTAVSARKELEELLGPASEPTQEAASEASKTVRKGSENLTAECTENTQAHTENAQDQTECAPNRAKNTNERARIARKHVKKLDLQCENFKKALMTQKDPEILEELEPELEPELELETVCGEAEESAAECTENAQTCTENGVFLHADRKMMRKMRDAKKWETRFSRASQRYSGQHSERLFCGRNRGSPSSGSPLGGSRPQSERSFTRGSCRRKCRRRGSSE